jgi:hypothetical protein
MAGSQHRPAPDVVLREVIVQPPDEPGGVVRLLTNLLDIDARTIALLYRYRWQVEAFHADYDEKDNLYRGDQWSYSSRACVVEAGQLVPAAQTHRSRRRFMRSAKEGIVPPRAENATISVCC